MLIRGACARRGQRPLGESEVRGVIKVQLNGRSIHIAGSANRGVPANVLRYSHRLISVIVEQLALQGARFVVGVGKEPRQNEEDDTSPSIIFDWTVLEILGSLLQHRAVRPKGPVGRLIATVATTKTENQIPVLRKQLWQFLTNSGAVHLEFVDPGWTSGAVRRRRQAQLGDVLLAIGGGEGVEHLAQLYALAGKPVIPLDLALGASMGDGAGGASRLALKALSHPSSFVRFIEPDSGGVLFSQIRTNGGQKPAQEVAAALLRLLEETRNPTAFYVRLLDPDNKEFAAVEDFLRQVVDPVIMELGFEPFEMSRQVPKQAWMNAEIFDTLHHSQLIVGDLTGSRPNCFIEVGYALGHQQATLITAREGTPIPFDAKMLEYHSWSELALGQDNEERIDRFRDYCRRNFERPPLVVPKSIL